MKKMKSQVVISVLHFHQFLQFLPLFHRGLEAQREVNISSMRAPVYVPDGHTDVTAATGINPPTATTDDSSRVC